MFRISLQDSFKECGISQRIVCYEIAKKSIWCHLVPLLIVEMLLPYSDFRKALLILLNIQGQYYELFWEIVN